MTVLFYRRGEAIGVADLPPGGVMRIWRPVEEGFPPPGPKRLQNFVWWTFSVLGVFARQDFTEISIWRGGRMLHRLIVTPRWYRFPFMARGDLQVGDVWTHPDFRGGRLAQAGVAEAHRRFADPFWYVVDAGNAASIRLIESCGYQLAGKGRRTNPFGIAALGQFRLES